MREVCRCGGLRLAWTPASCAGTRTLCTAAASLRTGDLLASVALTELYGCGMFPTGQAIRTLREHKGLVACVRFNPNGSLLASSGNDGTVRLWNVQTGMLDRCLPGHMASLDCLDFSPDGLRLATLSHNRTTRFWDMQTGKELGSPETPFADLTSICFSPTDCVWRPPARIGRPYDYGTPGLARRCCP